MAHKAWGRGDKCDHCDQKHRYKKFMEIYKPVNDMSLERCYFASFSTT